MSNKIKEIEPLVSDIKTLIGESKQALAVAVNATLSMLYWNIGKRINEEVEGKDRTEMYGKEIVATLWRQLSEEYGAAFSEKNLRRMMQFAKVFPEKEIVHTLCTQLSWSHIKLLIPIEAPLKREFYIEICKLEKWSVRTFQDRINSMLFERTAISKKPELTITNDLNQLKNEKQLSADLVFRDPYFLDFLGLKDTYSEKDLESAILVELQKFIIEMGSDFAFMARQKRTAISKKPELTITNDLNQLKNEKQLSADLVFRDPYFLDFLGLKDTYSEKDLESAILVELQKFIIEIGSDFAFMARQKRITIDDDDYYIDLLFYHRRLKSLVAIDLKLGKFEASHKGQMELYLRWLEKHEMVSGENPPIGLILCSSKNKEHIELLQLEHSNIKVAEYLTQLPDLKLLEEKLHRAIEIAKNKYSE